MYNREQDRWNEVVRGHWWGQGHYLIVKKMIENVLSGCGRHLRSLDIGCSGGTITDFLKRFGTVYGFDISYDGLAHCPAHSRILQASATQIPFRPQMFDIIALLDVAEHVDNEPLLFEEIRRVARNNAYIFVNVPAFSCFWRSHDIRYGHKRRYVLADFRRLAHDHGFTIEKSVYLHAHFVPPLFISAWLDRFSPAGLGKRDDFIDFGRLGNWFLFNTLRLEHRLLKYGSLPFGISLFCVLRRK